MKITVNDEVKVNNFPEGKDPISVFTDITEERKEEFQKDQSLYEFELDRYTLPQVIIKVLKSMHKYEVCEFITTRVDKLHSNFASHVFDQYSLFK